MQAATCEMLKDRDSFRAKHPASDREISEIRAAFIVCRACVRKRPRKPGSM